MSSFARTESFRREVRRERECRASQEISTRLRSARRPAECEALSVLLPALPASCPASIFVVRTSAARPAQPPGERFSRRCSLQVREAQDKEPVAPGTVYFAPANYHLLLDEGPQLALSADDLVHHSRPSIDVLFESAADVYCERLLGIILTGANEDGAAGLAAVHAAGGVNGGSGARNGAVAADGAFRAEVAGAGSCTLPRGDRRTAAYIRSRRGTCAQGVIHWTELRYRASSACWSMIWRKIFLRCPPCWSATMWRY